MSSQLLWFVGNRNPSITQQITSSGAPVDLTGATVTFRMRALGSTALKVDAAANIAVAAQGQVRYDWQAIDVDTEGRYLVWWRVTAGGKTQDMAESVIEFRAHGDGPGVESTYVELEEIKASLELNGTTFADQDILRAIRSASRAFDEATGRRFYLDVDATSQRVYTPIGARLLKIDDVVQVAAVDIDRDGDGVFEESWSTSDYILEPANAILDGRPYEWLRTRRLKGRVFSCGIDASVRVTGQFGWSAVPEDVKLATSILATRYLLRTRQAPFGIVTFYAEGAVAGIGRVVRTDPDVAPIVDKYLGARPFFVG